MDYKLNELIKQWLKTPEAERDYTVGAFYLLKLSVNIAVILEFRQMYCVPTSLTARLTFQRLIAVAKPAPT